MHHDSQHDHSTHASHHSTSEVREYIKFAAVIISIFAIAAMLTYLDIRNFMEALMGVFLVVFGGFKLVNLRAFAYGFQSYDIVAKHSLAYSYAYPFLQLSIGMLYLFGFAGLWLHSIALLIASIASIGVLRTLASGQKVHCVCLGDVIKLPLSRISFVEDFGMAIMALTMIFMA